ncbi:Outer dynein arm protein 1 [Larimichthys crocea]|uniref:Uncharacterized protein n=1 Tax=Larimichthys crocea TaxID=215358 RepID=A0ACD3RH54_LARCR|nr:Outer dynein arm protein 1 [Larimichthys crocea]
MESGEESLDALEEVFERIQTVTGEDNLDMLVTRFIQAEDRNFALFNFVNEQNNEAEALRDQISQIQVEIEEFRVAGLQQEKDHQSLLKDIDEQRQETEFKADNYENQANITSKILDEDLEKDYNPKDLAKFLLGQNPELLQQNVSIQPAIDSVDYEAEESSVTDEEEQPLSQEELRQRIIKGVLQKESSVRQAENKTSKNSQQFDGRRRSLEDALI